LFINVGLESVPGSEVKRFYHVHVFEQNADLANFRDVTRLAKPPTGKWQACENLWTEVNMLLKKTQEKKSPPLLLAAAFADA
jgi:hypothetical protein